MLPIIYKIGNYFRLGILSGIRPHIQTLNKCTLYSIPYILVNNKPSITIFGAPHSNSFYIRPATIWLNPYFSGLLMSMPCGTELKDLLMSSSITLIVDWRNQVYYSVIVGNTFSLTMVFNSSHAIYNPAFCDPQRICKFLLGW